MEYLIPVLLLWTSICVTLVHSIDFPVSEKYSTCPKKCDLSKCKKLSYCGGTIIKDECGCCQICSSDTWIHPKVSSVKQGGACEQVKCPKMKVCMENMQGLPLCTCPNLFICRRSNKQVCGSDDNTYQSRCHMRVASCTLGKRIRVKHKGACGMVATEHSGANKYPDGEFDIRRNNIAFTTTVNSQSWLTKLSEQTRPRKYREQFGLIRYSVFIKPSPRKMRMT
uniref:Kazal-like domain-containing protein n=1 Tax=Magallana gigas TaxID=29159 RepID=A0A8W8HT72_MAGGI